jgi:hypothetical protein
MYRWLRGTIASVSILMVTLSVTPVSAAIASRTLLPFSHFYAMVVDDLSGAVFISGGPSSTELAVFDGQAELTATIPVAGASGMTLLGTDLYVVAADAASIAVIDTTASPPIVTDTIDLAPLTNPTDLTYAAGNLWFYADSATHEGVLCSVAPDGSGLTEGPFEPGVFRFATGASGGSTLYSGSNGTMVAFDASTVPATVVKKNVGLPEILDSALLPGGSSLVYASGAPYVYPELSASDLSQIGEYGEIHPYPTAVAVTEAYGGLLVGGADGVYSPDVWTFHLGDRTAFWSYDFRDAGLTAAPHGVSWSSDGGSLFVVTTRSYGAEPALSVLHPPSSATKTAILTGSASHDHLVTGSPATITFHLKGGDDNRMIDVYQPSADHPIADLLIEGKVDSGGELTFPVTPVTNTSFRAYYDGDRTWLPAFDVVRLHVYAKIKLAMHGSYARAGRYFLYRRSVEPEAAITLVPNHSADYVRVVLEALGRDGWQKVAATADQLDVNSAGAVVIDNARSGVNYRIHTIFAGDNQNIATDSGYRFIRVDGGSKQGRGTGSRNARSLEVVARPLA